MSLSNAQSAVFAYLSANKPQGLPVYFPNVDATVPAGPHLRAQILSVPKFTRGLSAGPVQEPYIVQIDVMHKPNTGAIKPGETVAAVLAAFPRGLRLTAGGEEVRFDVEGSEAPSIPGSAWYQIPVSIPCYILR